MIRKLRNKFIFINMCFVTAILFAISAFLSVSYYQRNTRNSTFFLENELRRVMQGNSQDRTTSAPQPFPPAGTGTGIHAAGSRTGTGVYWIRCSPF